MSFPNQWFNVLSAALLLLFCAFLCSCSSTREIPSGTYQTKTPEESFDVKANQTPVLSAGDEISINVWREEDMDQSLEIDVNGNIFMPLAGSVQAEGKTVEELRSEITDKLSNYYQDPVVTIKVTNFSDQSFYILGEIEQAGTQTLNRQLSVFDAIMAASGPTDSADDTALLIRREEQSIRIVRVNIGFKKITDGSFNAHRLYVAKGDVIYVPPSLISDVESFAQSMSTILAPILDIERMLILWPSLVDALNNQTDVTVAF